MVSSIKEPVKSRQLLKFDLQILVIGDFFLEKEHFDCCLSKGCIAITGYLL